MTLDDEAVSWKAHEALERGEDPTAAKRRAEDARIEAIAQILGAHKPDLSERCLRELAGRMVAFAPRVIELLQPPAPEARDRVQLRQDWTSDLEDIVWWQEHTAHLKREYEDSLAILERVTAAAHRDRHDPDARDIDREDDRLREARQDEAAREQAPKVRAS